MSRRPGVVSRVADELRLRAVGALPASVQCNMHAAPAPAAAARDKQVANLAERRVAENPTPTRYESGLIEAEEVAAPIRIRRSLRVQVVQHLRGRVESASIQIGPAGVPTWAAVVNRRH